MTDVVERYLTLGLRLGRHVDGLVDAYYGPPEIAARVAAEDPVAPDALVADADALSSAVAGSGLEPKRRAWLGDQIKGLRTYGAVLAGEQMSYSDEVEGCYGVRPEGIPEETYHAAHERLEDLLPGSGSLRDRYDGWRSTRRIGPGRMIPALAAIVDILRARAAEIVDLPAAESAVLEEVRDEPWWAFNYYLGALRSRVVVNSDTLTTPFDLVMLGAHEVYPGHHTERAVREQLLVRDAGYVEEAIQLVPTPQALLSEGIAETGLDLLLDAGLRLELDELFTSHGLEEDIDLALEIRRARRPIGGLSVDAALIVHEHGGSVAEAKAFVERWGLRTPEQAEQSVRFVTDPIWRAYAITYSAGQDLCEAYVGGDPARFRTLLTEQVRVADLRAAHS